MIVDRVMLMTPCSSTIIEDVYRHCESDPSFAITYFYFDFNDAEKQQSENLIRSLITQLSFQSPSCPDALAALYSQNQNGQRQPTTESLMITLKSILRGFQHAYVILDALDECGDREQLLSLIEDITEWKLGMLHVLTTSRKEQDIDDCIGPIVSAQINLHSALVNVDIQTHLHERLKNDLKLKKWPTKVHEQIEVTLMEKADGM
jgi:hypothetical protein